MEKNTSDLLLDYDFSNGGGNEITYTNEDIELIENIIPYRREGSFYCLPHIDEGFVNGTWAKGATTAANEKRFVTEMQQGKINYKNDGLNSLKYELVNTEMFMDNCLMINVKM
jgi:alpha-D-ribose 1-methylphosphonate 5-triphosphate synthase subunit PhnI